MTICIAFGRLLLHRGLVALLRTYETVLLLSFPYGGDPLSVIHSFRWKQLEELQFSFWILPWDSPMTFGRNHKIFCLFQTQGQNIFAKASGFHLVQAALGMFSKTARRHSALRCFGKICVANSFRVLAHSWCCGMGTQVQSNAPTAF